MPAGAAVLVICVGYVSVNPAAVKAVALLFDKVMVSKLLAPVAIVLGDAKDFVMVGGVRTVLVSVAEQEVSQLLNKSSPCQQDWGTRQRQSSRFSHRRSVDGRLREQRIKPQQK